MSLGQLRRCVWAGPAGDWRAMRDVEGQRGRGARRETQLCKPKLWAVARRNLEVQEKFRQSSALSYMRGKAWPVARLWSLKIACTAGSFPLRDLRAFGISNASIHFLPPWESRCYLSFSNTRGARHVPATRWLSSVHPCASSHSSCEWNHAVVLLFLWKVEVNVKYWAAACSNN